MNEIYLTIADGFEKLAAGYRALAGDAVVPTEGKVAPVVETPVTEPEITIEEVRAVLAAKSEAGKRKEVKDLLLKYDSGKLSGVKKSDYAALLADARAL